MSEQNFTILTLDNIFKKCVKKQSMATMSQQKSNLIISEQAYSEVWNSLVKWSKTQLDQEMSINFQNIFYISNNQLSKNEAEKYIHLTPQETFLAQNNLQFKKPQNLEIKHPMMQFNILTIHKNCNLEKEIAQQAVTNILHEIKEIFLNQNNVELDLGQFGKFIIIDKLISFMPFVKNKITATLSKQTVQNLMDVHKQVSRNRDPNGSLLKEKTNLSFIKKQQEEEKYFESLNQPLQSKSKLEPLKQNKSMTKFQMSKMDDTGGEIPQSPTRRFKKPDQVHIIPEMLGAGTDPLAKEVNLSRLNNAKDLMFATFQKPANAAIRFPPILDKFSRTLASPICSQKYNLPASSRIGSNYTKLAQRIYLDPESKQIKIAKINHSKVSFTANQELLQKPANEEEELTYILTTEQSIKQALRAKVEAKKTCYSRYRAYIENEIEAEYIAPIKQYWISDILELIPGDFLYLERSFVQKMFDRMLSEISRDYYDSVRKSILDYVLKDDEEKLRVGIMETFDSVVDYGNNIYMGIEADDLWKEDVNKARDDISSRLVICNKATLNIMKLWKDYENKYFLQLPEKKDQPMNIDHFNKLQKDRIDEIKHILTNDWQRELTEIYQEELSHMNKNKKQAILFFESSATLMANQMRALITDSLIYYRDFFRRFKKDKYKMPEEIIEDEKNPKALLADAFLFVRLKYEDNQIKYADDLDFIKQELLRIIFDIVEASHNFSRPDNELQRNDKNCIHKVPDKDEEVQYQGQTHKVFQDETVRDVYNEIEEILTANLEIIKTVVKTYDKYAFLLVEMSEVDKFISDPNKKMSEYKDEIQKYQRIYQEVKERIPFYVRMNIINVDGVEVKKKYLKVCLDIHNRLLAAIYSNIIERNKKTKDQIEGLKQKIQAKADSEEKLVEIEGIMDKIRQQDYKALKHEFEDLCKWLGFMQTYEFYDYDPEIKQQQERGEQDTSLLQKMHKLSELVHTLLSEVDEQETKTQKEKEDLEKKLRDQITEFQKSLEDLDVYFDKLKNYSDRKFDIQKALPDIEILDKKIKDYTEESRNIIKRQELLKWTLTDFVKLEEAQQKLKPHKKLWTLINQYTQNYQSWANETCVYRLDPEEIEKSMKLMWKEANSLSALFDPKATKSQQLSANLVNDIQNFNKCIPLIKILCNPGMKERHWVQIKQLIEHVNPDSDQKLYSIMEEQEILENTQIFQHMDKLAEIDDTASKEYSIEKILNLMEEGWETMICEIKDAKAGGTYIVSGVSVDEVQTLLDDQIVKTQTIAGSPFAQIFKKKIEDWEDQLNLTQNIFDYWVKVQQIWIYLEPIFSSPDIIKHLQEETSKFKEVDSMWRANMKKIHSNPKVLEIIKIKKLLDYWKDSYANLEVVQKGLNSYLEGKRASFPRFYFLSNDELLEILSETKDPLRVQPHLKKCFEGIQKLKFDQDKKIHGMYSSEGEYVQFQDQIDTMAAKGQVDQWLLQVEKYMVESLQKYISDYYHDYTKVKRDKFVQGRCGQAVLGTTMIYWTLEAEQAMNDEGIVGITKYEKQCTEQLQDIVALTRSNLEVLDRCTIEALIVLDVHNRDIISELVHQQIGNVSHFQWVAQLRYYMKDEKDVKVTFVRIINAQLSYNYEYIGNSSRLVITPLTDRCYRTLCGAIHLNYGGAPEGPAGTGKTETVKDLAKALSRQCVVFNCSDGLDYKAMGKFFKGLASSGAWSCFDEFNRIDLEVLSVIAQQVRCIQLNIAKGVDNFFFEDAYIKLIPTCNVFITMNPGYAGRSELPDNLKALFRTVAMMVPDYAMIAKISLYSYGFSDGENLARKIVATYKLCSEQLSSQRHYDYGMRAVKSVLIAAGNLKRKFPEESESILMLRSITDVNLPKFLAYDLPLFQGIASDLFPSVKIPEIDYKAMFEAINNQLTERNQLGTPYFISKIIQLYETILVRHGLMVVGMSFSGKTSIIKILAGALGELCQKNLMGEQKVQICTLNPKSITMKQLYGWADKSTNEWTDGLLGVKFRMQAKDETPDRKWLHFDGPVDAVWIENMNTVLDDNKKLCLNSGEIIAMSKQMNMIFEPQDLLVASPATVSRCGMVYMESQEMGWQPIYHKWKIEYMPSHFKEEDKAEIELLFKWAVDPLLQFVRKSCTEISVSQDQNLVMTLMLNFKNFIAELNDEKLYNTIDAKNRISILDNFFIFSLVWSLGASLKYVSRKPFDNYLRKLFEGDIKIEDPEIKTKKISLATIRGLLYDYKYQLKSSRTEGEWVQWIDLINSMNQIDVQATPQSIIVETADTMRYSFVLKTNILNEISTLFCGPTGTGKTIYINDVIMNKLPSDYSSIQLGFSAQTSETQTQDIIDGKLDRVRKGVYGPKFGKCILFVDDLNMPAKETWGAQPPIELLRQFLDQGGWYDLKDKEKPYKKIQNVLFVSAMGEPGGGKTFITPRILRHCNLVSLTDFEEESLNRIFTAILGWFFQTRNFDEQVAKCENKIVKATQDIYTMVLEKLLPTPQKSHYLFNMRDFSKVILGITMTSKEVVKTEEQIIRLWVHEVFRVFGDRLISEEDKLFLLSQIRDHVVRNRFGQSFDNVFLHLDHIKDGKKDGKVDTLDEIRQLMFTDIMVPAGVNKRYYEEVVDFTKLQTSVNNSLRDYNIISDKPMRLVLFNFAIEHLLIIARILNQPGGNALLVGVGGSGRQSLTRLAAKIQDLEVFQIEITKLYGQAEWRDDLRSILKKAGAQNQPTVFLFTDTQIKEEGFVEDVNNLLNTSEVPNLFPTEDKVEIIEKVRALYKAEGKVLEGTPTVIYSKFIELVKKNLHIVLCFSPIGDAFRNRVRMFPSLVNCCTIDWFSEWPSDALFSVAKEFMEPIELDKETKMHCVEMVQYFHESTIQWAAKFYNQLRRKYYVTPTSYLEMLSTFQRLLDEKRKQVSANKYKYENGYQKIITTEGTVEIMKAELIEKKPLLKQAAEQTKKKMEEVAVEKEAADKLKAEISEKEAEAQVAVNEANVIKEDCQAELDLALPKLLNAERALDVITKDQINTVKSYKTVAVPIKNTLHAVCLLLYPNPKEKVKNEKTLMMEVDWWAASVNLMNRQNPDFLSQMKTFKEVIEAEKIEEKYVANLGKFLQDPEIEPTLDDEKVKNSSEACGSIIKWVKGIFDFYYVNKKIIPKRIQLKIAEEKAAKFNALLEIEQKKLKAAQDKVDKLNNELMLTERNKKKLEADYELCSNKLERAYKLIENLGGEKGRWKEYYEMLSEQFVNLTGDVLVASGMIAYLGSFTSFYRSQITTEWVAKNLEMQIPSSKVFTLSSVLGDPVKIRQWNIFGLPSDQFSVENAIIVQKSRRWPLLVDPQQQANKWIKRMEKDRKLQIIKFSDSNYLRTLENSIQFGQPVLLENVHEDLDPAIEPILLKQTTTKGKTQYIKLGDQTIEYSPEFFLYITTKLKNPHYLPEVSIKITMINFMITYEGLFDQLLGILVSMERPDLEAEKERLILESAANKKDLFEIEAQILSVLSEASDILSDEKAINILTASKVKSNEINEKQIVAEKTEKEIDTARAEYQEVSKEASFLFFAITDLGNIDPMYQYSLVYYIDLFKNSIKNSEKSSELDHRLKNLRSYFLSSLYRNICRSLFEKDKLLFSFVLSSKIAEFKNQLDLDQWRFLLTGGISLDEQIPDPPECNWLQPKYWQEICRLSKFEEFKLLPDDIKKHTDQWQFIYDSLEPQNEKLTVEFETKLNKFQRLLVLRVLRPDKVVPAVQNYVKDSLGPEFIDPPPFDLPAIYLDSSNVTPLIFVLSPGSDPFASLNLFATQKAQTIKDISLGQGQGPIAEKMIQEGQEKGFWVVLQNCHLAVSWMSTLEKICEQFVSNAAKINNNFRLWLTSYPSPHFPQAILQSGVKMTNEPPKGLRANLTGSFNIDPINTQEFFESCQKPKIFKRLLFSLTFFHAVIQERRKFGPLGWNIPYEFNETDLRISVQQLKMFLDEDSDVIPFDALKYLTGECNYGGRVTDDKDRSLIITLLLDYYNENAARQERYQVAEDPCYVIPDCDKHEQFLEFIKTLPLRQDPGTYGFHSNADITKDLNETQLLFTTILIAQSSSGGGKGQSREEVLKKLCETIRKDLPGPFNVVEAQKKYKLAYLESMNIVLTQELDRFNGLIKIIHSSLKDISRALVGEILMSPDLEAASNQLVDGRVPAMWMNKSYPSLKPLGSYINDLKARIQFFQNWLDHEQPANFWISGFYFTQSFLTGVKQNYARKYVIAIDEVEFDFKIIDKGEVNEKPEDGAYVYGLYIEGAKWNYENSELDESDPKILFVKCPTILLMPAHMDKLSKFDFYDCPVYKTSERRGVLSTTGHSTNFVMKMKLPSRKSQAHWIKRGVAMLTQLDD